MDLVSATGINNNMDGECKIVYSNGDYYNGQIKNNKLIGNGKCKKTFYTSGIGNKQIKYVYEGSLLDGKKNGYGILTFFDGCYYQLNQKAENR